MEWVKTSHRYHDSNDKQDVIIRKFTFNYIDKSFNVLTFDFSRYLHLKLRLHSNEYETFEVELR